MTPLVSTSTSTTADVVLPTRAIDRVIGQSQAVAMAKLAARQRRFLFLIGEPGTGKSLIGRAMAELLSARGPRDITVALPNPGDPMRPLITTMSREEVFGRERALSALAQGRLHTRRMLWMAVFTSWVAVSYVVLRQQSLWREWLAVTMTGGFCTVIWTMSQRGRSQPRPCLSPKVLVPDANDIPFVDATGLTAGALFGDVRHDPYQSGGFETAPHLLIEPGAIHRAHGGILYIDEISTLSQDDQRLLLTAIQDRALPISGRSSGSSGSLVRTDPVPCDFILVAAGHEDDLGGILPPLRSRMRGMGYEVRMASMMAAGENEQLDIMRFIAQEVASDGRIPHFDRSGTAALIQEAARMAEVDKGGGEAMVGSQRTVAVANGKVLTLRLRELGGLIRLAGDLAVQEAAPLATERHVNLACELRHIPDGHQSPRKGMLAPLGTTMQSKPITSRAADLEDRGARSPCESTSTVGGTAQDRATWTSVKQGGAI
jgi:lon-related putative ATP-dependent protease